MRKEVLESTGGKGTVLRVEFVWHGDRFAHVLSIVNSDGSVVPLLESLEGTPADDWPPSPPLQHLHRETLAGGRDVLLLVGAAGRSHWSASIEAAATGPEFSFDIACRRGAPPGWVGSRYRVQTAALHWAISSELTRIVRDDSQVCIEPAPARANEATLRWKFSVRLGD